MIGAIPNNALGFDDDVLYERRLVESQRKTVFRGKEVDRVLSEAAKTHVDRVRLAKRSHVPQNRRKYGLTKSHESDLAEAIGGKTSKDQNEPFDIYTDQHAIEVKTIVESGYDRITMHPKSLKVKKAIAESLGLKPHTVVFDTRKGREAVYYREGLGSFRLNQMKKVPSLEAVREALEFGVKGMKWGVRKGKDNSSKVALDFPDKISENSFYHVAPIGSVRGILSKGLGKSDKSYVSDNLSEIEHFATEWTAGEKGSYALVELDKSKIPSQINKTLKVDKAAVSVWGAETRARSFNGTIPPSAIKKITIVKVRDVGTEEDPELEHLVRKIIKLDKSSKESLREYGVKGQKWGVRRKRDEKKGIRRSLAKPFKGRMKVTVLMGINGSGKSTLLKNLVQRYGEDETDVDGNKWNVISRKGKRAALMGNYSSDEHINAGRYFIRGNFWSLLGRGVKDLKREGVQNVIVDAKRLAFGKQHDNMIKFAKRAGIDLEFVRVKTPPDVAAERIGKRREKYHKTKYPPGHLEWQDQQVGEHFSKRPESSRLTLKNDRHTNLRREAKKLAKFALRESGGNVNESYSSGISVPREAEVFA